MVTLNTNRLGNQYSKKDIKENPRYIGGGSVYIIEITLIIHVVLCYQLQQEQLL